MMVCGSGDLCTLHNLSEDALEHIAPNAEMAKKWSLLAKSRNNVAPLISFPKIQSNAVDVMLVVGLVVHFRELLPVEKCKEYVHSQLYLKCPSPGFFKGKQLLELIVPKMPHYYFQRDVAFLVIHKLFSGGSQPCSYGAALNAPDTNITSLVQKLQEVEDHNQLSHRFKALVPAEAAY
ncbi:hypothetical protein Pelo_4033 [Pelomyxa schiedti]|nr:hypothetical protein Pelo_4033 [Pelomyxa schiedti]